MQYVGFTLNIRPRVTGGDADEVALQMEVLVNELGPRQRVFEEDLAGIPSVTTRHYVGMNRVKNHRPIILGGLIQEQDVESVNKIPLLADIPLLGYLFRRTQKSQSRNEIILVVTPHILSETGVDPRRLPRRARTSTRSIASSSTIVTSSKGVISSASTRSSSCRRRASSPKRRST